MARKDYICPVCEKKFQSYAKQRTTCSRDCLAKYQTFGSYENCPVCDMVFFAKKSDKKRASVVTCSVKCAHKIQETKRVKYPELRNAEWCKEQYKTLSLSKIANQLGCGETTVYKFFKKHEIDLDRKKWLSGIKKTDEHKRNLSKSIIENRSHSGEKNSNWRGGITSFHKRVRSLEEYNRWRIEVLKNNKKICVLCGTTERLEVDHIKQFRFIISDNNIKNIEDARSCNELWDINNGRILCRKCNINREFNNIK